MIRFSAIAFLLFASFASASLTNVYVSQAAVGANSGTDCSNAHAVTFFNTAGDWGPGTAQIGQDTTVHLCGKITTGLKFQAGGASGHPITLLWEPGAVISLPVCYPDACVNGEGFAYLVLDGGANGIIENTANGSMFANHSSTNGVTMMTCTSCEVKHLLVRNMYVHTPTVALVSVAGNGSVATGTCIAACGFVAGVTARIVSNSVSSFNGDQTVLTASGSTFTFSSSTNSTGTGGVVGDVTIDDAGARSIVLSGSNWSIHDNVVHDASWSVWNYYQAGLDVGGRIYNNEIYNVDHAIIVAGWGPHDVGPFYIYNNHIHDFQNWDSPTGHWHHDGIHAFTSNVSGFPNVTQLWIYNNVFDGDAGDNMTGHVFLEGNSGSPWTRSVADGGTGRAIVFNNVFIGTVNRVVNGYVQVGNSSGSEVYNNTLLCGNTSVCFAANNAPNYKFKNNFVSGSSNVLVTFAGTTSFAAPGDLDNNVYANCSSFGNNCLVWHAATYTNDFSIWQIASGGDAHSTAVFGNAGGVNSAGIPLAGSPVIGAGANLANLGIADLNSDRLAAPRPLSGGWTIGAYNFAGSVLPVPPTHLTVTVK